MLDTLKWLHLTFLQYNGKLGVSVRSSSINHTLRNGMPASISRERIMATHFIPSRTCTSLTSCHLTLSRRALLGWFVSCLSLVYENTTIFIGIGGWFKISDTAQCNIPFILGMVTCNLSCMLICFLPHSPAFTPFQAWVSGWCTPRPPVLVKTL